jgi:hypothetical protein
MEIGQFRSCDPLHSIGSQQLNWHCSWKQARHFSTTTYTVFWPACICLEVPLSNLGPETWCPDVCVDLLQFLKPNIIIIKLCVHYHLRHFLLSILPCFFVLCNFFDREKISDTFLTRWTTAMAQLLPINCHDLFYKPNRVCDCATTSRTVRQIQTRTCGLPNSIVPSAVRNETTSKFMFPLVLTYRIAWWR